MQRYRIVHRTYYNFSAPVTLGVHSLLLRPRENHELRIESLSLDISPPAELRWHRDVEDNSVAIATFGAPVQQLAIKSDVIICQYLEKPLDLRVLLETLTGLIRTHHEWWRGRRDRRF